MTKSLEDYLEAIGNLAVENNNPRVKDIAAVLDVSKPSVHTALHILEDRGMIKHEYYGSIIMTEAGFQTYRQIKDKHDTLSMFLQKIIGVSPETADKDACKMEHIISSETFAKIKQILAAERKIRE
ncbi:MAG: metal-dependent transcriptional regulator [Bacteroides sp.]|nr:metal-dependent transcriptional regulator [Prevotella sp.]MCM1407299.1 metal-dependent transcriptional regulator [Treponema brennaborense]MCM1469787.1 metal-dependent transcriptional regulator [Bacteroides sp.]